MDTVDHWIHAGGYQIHLVWQAFWHNRFFALQLSSIAPQHGHINVQAITDADINFIKNKRAEVGLPPIE